MCLPLHFAEAGLFCKVGGRDFFGQHFPRCPKEEPSKCSIIIWTGSTFFGLFHSFNPGLPAQDALRGRSSAAFYRTMLANNFITGGVPTKSNVLRLLISIENLQCLFQTFNDCFLEVSLFNWNVPSLWVLWRDTVKYAQVPNKTINRNAQSISSFQVWRKAGLSWQLFFIFHVILCWMDFALLSFVGRQSWFPTTFLNENFWPFRQDLWRQENI